jgi:hypothetical protein
VEALKDSKNCVGRYRTKSQRSVAWLGDGLMGGGNPDSLLKNKWRVSRGLGIEIEISPPWLPSCQSLPAVNQFPSIRHREIAAAA